MPPLFFKPADGFLNTDDPLLLLSHEIGAGLSSVENVVLPRFEPVQTFEPIQDIIPVQTVQTVQDMARQLVDLPPVNNPVSVLVVTPVIDIPQMARELVQLPASVIEINDSVILNSGLIESKLNIVVQSPEPVTVAVEIIEDIQKRFVDTVSDAVKTLVKIPGNVLDIHDAVISNNGLTETKPSIVIQSPEPVTVAVEIIEDIQKRFVDTVSDAVKTLVKIPGNILDIHDAVINNNGLYEGQKPAFINAVPEPVTFNPESIAILENNYKAGILSDSSPIKTLIPAVSVPVQQLVQKQDALPKMETKTFDLTTPIYIGIGLLLFSFLTRKN